jgi:pyruvate kinase
MSKILPTIGPITESVKSIRKILEFSHLVRINGAHNNLLWHKKISNRIKNNKDAKILLDLPGIKPRTDNKISHQIKKNQEVIFYSKKCKIKNILKIKITAPIPKIIKKISFFSVNDGKYFFKIKKINKDFVLAKSLANFELKKKKGINFPNSVYDEKLQKKIYLSFLKKTKGIKFDAVGLSYVQNANLIDHIRKFDNELLIVSKIENIKGLENIDQISKKSDVIMIDRGDLSAEIGEHKLFNALQKISKVVKSNGKPLIMATENLESMVSNKSLASPTKSEIVALSHSNNLLADLIMLSDETATSENWHSIIKWLNSFLKKINKKNNKIKDKKDVFWNAIKEIKNTPFVIFTKKGYALDKIDVNDSVSNLTVFTDNKKVKSFCDFKLNTTCIQIKNFTKSKNSNFIYNNIKKYKKIVFSKSNKAILIYVAYPRRNSRANTFSVISEKDF